MTTTALETVPGRTAWLLRPRDAPPDPPMVAVEPRAQTTITALPLPVDLAVYQGDDIRFTLTVTDADGSATDLTGAVATSQIRTSPADTDILATFDCTIAANVITLHLPSAQSTNLTANAVWDCQIATPEVLTLVAGKVTVALEVTR